MALFDLHHRRINYLRVSVTDRCNHHCLYCRPGASPRLLPHDQILSYEEIHRVAALAVALGIRKIRLTGGEPLLRRDLVGLVRRLRSIPDLAEISLTTNGRLLAPVAAELYEAGIRRVNVSLDTLDAAAFRKITGGGSLDEVWRGIARAHEVGFDPIKLNVVVLRGVNDHEIPRFLRLVRDGPYHVRFIEFMPLGAGPYRGEHLIPTRKLIERVRAFVPIEPVPRHVNDGPATRYRVHGARGSIGFIIVAMYLPIFKVASVVG